MKLHKPVIAISACLLGQNVRFNGGHKKNSFLIDTLGEHVDFSAFCPEVAIGLGVPRPTLRLRDEGGDGPRLVPSSGEGDHTAEMKDYARTQAKSFLDGQVHGLVLKSDSPSCGVFRVKVYNEHGMAERKGRGIAAAEIIDQHPLLPVEEDGRLNDPRLRENFICRVFAYRQFHEMLSDGVSWSALYGFHARYKYRLMAHHSGETRALGRYLAQSSSESAHDVASGYLERFMAILSQLPTKGSHANSLWHMSGYFKSILNVDERQDMHKRIDAYRDGVYPLIVPVSFIRHYSTKYGVSYVGFQSYLEPYPQDMGLMNAV